MTKKEYFLYHLPYAHKCTSASTYYALYGVDYKDINDYAYIAYETHSGIQSMHRLIVHYTKDGSAYVILHGRRLYIAEFN